MNSALKSRLKIFLMRMIFYAAAAFVVLALIAVPAFFFAKPKLLALAKAEMRKNGIEAQSVNIGILGYAHMRKVRVSLPQGGQMQAEALAVRPPLHFFGQTWLGGSGKIYNLSLQKGAISVSVPELRFSGLSLEDKDPKITSRGLQMLYRLRADKIAADKIKLAVNPQAAGAGAAAGGKDAAAGLKSAKLQATMRGFALSGLNRGKIAAISYSGMESEAALAGGRSGAAEEKGAETGTSGAAAKAAADKTGTSGPAAKAAADSSAAQADMNAAARQSNLHSGAFRAENLDVFSLYMLAKNMIPADEGGAAAEMQFPKNARGLIGKIRLSDVNIAAEDAEFGSVRFSAAELGSNGLALKGKAAPAEFIRRLPASAGGEAKKQIFIHNLRLLLADIASVDFEAQRIIAEVKPNRTDKAGDDAAPSGSAAQAAGSPAAALASPKTVRDILDEESQKAEQAQDSDDSGEEGDAAAAAKPGKKLSLPLDFKLELASFAVRANHWQQAIPYDVYVKVKDLAYLPGKTDNELIAALHNLGHEDLQFSFLGEIAWNPADSALNISRLAFYSRGMGGFSAKAKLLNLPKSVFDGKPQAIAQALNEAAVANIDITMKDSGFIKNLVQWGTEQINISAQELQGDLYDIAVKSPPLLLKNAKEADNLADIFGSFVKNSGAIRLDLTAPPPDGLKLSDILAAQDDLSILLGKLKLTAERLPPDTPIE